MRGSIRKVERKSGHAWRVQVDLPRGPDGERNRKTKTFDSKTAAEKWLHRINAEIDAHGYHTEGGKQPLRVYLADWLQEYSQREHREKVHYDYTKIIENHINPVLGDIPLENLSPRRIQTFVNDKLDHGRIRGDGGLSVGTVKKIFHVLSGALNRALKLQMIRHNPARPVSIPTDPKTHEDHQSTLTSEQVRRLLAVAEEESTYGAALYHVALLLGLRISEITGLRWEDVDFEKGTVSIRQVLIQTGKDMKFNPPKTKNSRRTIGLPDALAKRLKKHRQQQAARKMRIRPEWEEYDLVFPATDGSPLRHRNLRRELNKLLDNADMPRVRFHDLRHSCATLMMEGKQHPKIVKELLGHSSVETTLDVYSHVSADIQKRASQALEDHILHAEDSAQIG